ncbi:MAG TPA: hypothetical protein VFV73_36085 [Streptosporangiaceae bacterium]|nr:hypothetical protein [Streptosporangiaceae bacterium]
MTETLDPLPSPVEDAQFLLQELACVSGTVSEIMTMWRRACPFRPELELGRLARLQDAARQLGAEIRAAVAASQHPTAGLAGRFPALGESVVAARTLASGPDISGVGDDGLWESVVLALRRAETRLSVRSGS